jgi:hypothetical protein
VDHRRQPVISLSITALKRLRATRLSGQVSNPATVETIVSQLRPIEHLEVLVFIENTTESRSTNPRNVTSEWSGLLTSGGLHKISGRSICCAHHGLSLLITAQIRSEKRTLSCDAGPEGATLLRNAKILGVDFGAVDAVVLSPGHWDYADGRLSAIEAISMARPTGAPDCFVPPGMVTQRAFGRPNGEVDLHEEVPDAEQLARAGAKVVNTREPRLAARSTSAARSRGGSPDMKWVSLAMCVAAMTGSPGRRIRSLWTSASCPCT